MVFDWQAVTARGGRFLEAPLVGNKQSANSGQLIILAAGDFSVFEDCSSCFEAVGKRSFFLGTKVDQFIYLLGLCVNLLRDCIALASKTLSI